jgi:murein DD-endopeptidase MepM/ murein hydrolase activator NlpD
VIFPPLDSPDSSELKKVMSISLPATPTGFAAPVAGVSDSSGIDLRRQAMASNMTQRLQQRSPTSQSNNGRLTDETTAFQSPPPTPGGGRSSMSRDKRYDSFKTWSGRLERQISHLAGIGPDIPSPAGQVVDAAMDGHHHSHTVSTPEVGRFFAALEGPELDQLRVSYRKINETTKK